MSDKHMQQGNITAFRLEPNIAALLTYVLWWLSGLIIFLIEKENKFVRFHDIQSMVIFGFITMLLFMLKMFKIIFLIIFWDSYAYWNGHALFINDLFMILFFIIRLGAIVLTIILIKKAYQNEILKIPIASKIAEKYM